MTSAAAAPMPMDARRELRTGATVSVGTAATTANIGPGFDSLGMAFNLLDEVTLTTGVGKGVIEIEVSGEGADSVRRDDHHLVVRSMRTLLVPAGITGDVVSELGGLHLKCTNRIPHGRGLGSSAAAIGAGILLARALLKDAAGYDDAVVLDLLTAAEGHPDNAAAVVYGGFTVAWMNAGAPVGGGLSGVAKLDVHPDLHAVVLIPDFELSTDAARALLPREVPHADAAFNAGRSALLVHAMTRDPALLMEATQDRIHQEHRRPAMPASLALMDALRAQGIAATVSGAGPCVLALGIGSNFVARVQEIAERAEGNWQAMTEGIRTQGAQVVA